MFLTDGTLFLRPQLPAAGFQRRNDILQKYEMNTLNMTDALAQMRDFKLQSGGGVGVGGS